MRFGELQGKRLLGLWPLCGLWPLWVAAVACGTGGPTEPAAARQQIDTTAPAAPDRPTLATASATAASGGTASHTASAATTPPPPASAPTPPPSAAPNTSAAAPPPAPVAAPTEIECGEAICARATEVCCFKKAHPEQFFDEPGRCVARRGANPCAEDEYPKRCDEPADCSGGRTCCKVTECNQGGCPVAAYRCQAPPCATSEVCHHGSPCRKGAACRVPPGTTDGWCEPERRPPRCGPQACTKAAPICCWNGDKRTGECHAQCIRGTSGVLRSLECDSPASCGGTPCVMLQGDFTGGFVCRGSALAKDAAVEAACRRVSDCPRLRLHATKANPQGRAVGCLASDDMPPTMKLCVYPPGPQP